MSELLKDNQEFLLKIVNKIESTDQLRLQILQKIIVFHFDHELGLSLKYEIAKLLHPTNKIQLNREFKNIISDIEFENYGSDYKKIIGDLKTDELDLVVKELLK